MRPATRWAGARAKASIIAIVPRYDAIFMIHRSRGAPPDRLLIIKRHSSSTLVYSTDPATNLAAHTATSPTEPPTSGAVRLSYETKGRKGKGVTIVRGVPLAQSDLEALGKQLRSQCGSGGTVKDGVIEIQGDHRSRVEPILQARGWNVKRTGG